MYYICYRITRNLQWCMALGTRLVPSYTNSPWWRMSACQNQIISKVKILSMHLLRPIYSTRYNYDCHSGICNRLHHRVPTSDAVSTCFQLPNWHERQKITSRQFDRWKQVFPLSLHVMRAQEHFKNYYIQGNSLWPKIRSNMNYFIWKENERPTLSYLT